MVCKVSLRVGERVREKVREVARGGEREDTDQNNKQLCERVGPLARESRRAARQESG